MEIVINHLTRMQPGYICVAGLDPTTGRHVRPILTGRLSTVLLARNGGPFDMAALVDLGPTTPAGEPPAVEDQRFEPWQVRRRDTISPGAFWQSLRHVASASLAELFGSDLRAHDQSCVVAVGAGRASLGCLVPTGQPHLTIE
ncbi:MAG: hypothetical protein IVW57_20020, partial [Ktedonobacterales bacterium]|nr:hypothetical protein [Ktedonobacterales bacterium]